MGKMVWPMNRKDKGIIFRWMKRCRKSDEEQKASFFWTIYECGQPRLDDEINQKSVWNLSLDLKLSHQQPRIKLLIGRPFLRTSNRKKKTIILFVNEINSNNIKIRIRYTYNNIQNDDIYYGYFIKQLLFPPEHQNPTARRKWMRYFACLCLI